MREEQPANHTANDVACRKGNVEVKGLDCRPASRLEEDDNEAKNRITAENLSRPDNAVLID